MNCEILNEILFRGKSIVDNEWVYGDLLHKRDGVFIWDRTFSDDCMRDAEQVIPETVSQILFRENGDGHPVFTGDIVRYTTNSGVTGVGIVEISSGSVRILPADLPLYRISSLEKIGNKWDNSGLYNLHTPERKWLIIESRWSSPRN